MAIKTEREDSRSNLPKMISHRTDVVTVKTLKELKTAGTVQIWTNETTL